MYFEDVLKDLSYRSIYMSIYTIIDYVNILVPVFCLYSTVHHDV